MLMFKVFKASSRIVDRSLRFGIKSGRFENRPLLCPEIKVYVMFNKVQKKTEKKLYNTRFMPFRVLNKKTQIKFHSNLRSLVAWLEISVHYKGNMNKVDNMKAESWRLAWLITACEMYLSYLCV